MEFMHQHDARIGSLMAVASMACVQLGLACAVLLIDRVGAEGTAWLRLVFAAVIFLVTMLTGTAQLIYTRRRRVQL